VRPLTASDIPAARLVIATVVREIFGF